MLLKNADTQASVLKLPIRALKREERIVIIPNPTTADADDDFGFTTTISFFNDGKRYNPSTDTDE